MHLVSYRGYVARVERDPENGAFVGRLRDVPDDVGFRAPTLAALPARMARAVDDYIASRQEWGLPAARPFAGERRVRFQSVRESA